MCPAILVRDDGQRFAMGAAGGRRILPVVMQLISFLVDYRMGAGEVVHQPRIDVSGTPTVAIDRAMPGPVAQGLAARFDTRLIPHGVHPSLFAAPGIVGRDRHSGRCAGAVFVPSPWSKVSGA